MDRLSERIYDGGDETVSPGECDALMARAEASTVGRWRLLRHNVAVDNSPGAVLLNLGRVNADSSWLLSCMANVPRLIRTLREARAENERLRATIAAVMESGTAPIDTGPEGPTWHYPEVKPWPPTWQDWTDRPREGEA